MVKKHPTYPEGRLAGNWGQCPHHPFSPCWTSSPPDSQPQPQWGEYRLMKWFSQGFPRRSRPSQVKRSLNYSSRFYVEMREYFETSVLFLFSTYLYLWLIKISHQLQHDLALPWGASQISRYFQVIYQEPRNVGLEFGEGLKDGDKDLNIVLVSLGCCNRNMRDWVAKTTSIYFSQFWRLGNPSSGNWEIQCLVRAQLLACKHSHFLPVSLDGKEREG